MVPLVEAAGAFKGPFQELWVRCSAGSDAVILVWVTVMDLRFKGAAWPVSLGLKRAYSLIYCDYLISF